jgi:hypothetical protein
MRRTWFRDLLAVGAVGVVSFALSTVWYSPLVFGDVWARASDASLETTPGWKFAFAPLREIISAAVVLFLVRRVRAADWKSTIAFALVLWLGFYVVQLSGAVIWDQMPWALGAVHAGDWLMKLLVMTSLLGAWHRREAVQQPSERRAAVVSMPT